MVIDSIFNSLVLPGTGNSLRASLADEQAVAGTSHISKKSNDKYCSLTKALTESYFLPGGAFLIGVASLQALHLTTCWSFLPEMSIIA